MIRLAKWMARSAFGIGCAIGLMTNLSLLPLVEQAQAASAVACDPTWCGPGPSVPQEVRDFITTQFTVHAAKLSSAQRQLQMDLAACGVLVVTP